MKMYIEFEHKLLHILCILIISANCQDNGFASYFRNCHKGDSKFDSCIKDALNEVRKYFKTGLPQYGVTPFDPFYAKEVPLKMGGPNLNYRLLLKNVYEAGWTVSEVTHFRSNLNKNMIQYTQFFPDKNLYGEYEISGKILGAKIRNQGNWNLTLDDYVQTTTLTRKPRRAMNGTLIYDTPIKVNVNVQTCRDLKLHITNLLKGRSVLESMLDRIINGVWRPGFVVLKPVINDLGNTAFTEIFTKSFRNFPFNEIIH